MPAKMPHFLRVLGAEGVKMLCDAHETMELYACKSCYISWKVTSPRYMPAKMPHFMEVNCSRYMPAKMPHFMEVNCSRYMPAKMPHFHGGNWSRWLSRQDVPFSRQGKLLLADIRSIARPTVRPSVVL